MSSVVRSLTHSLVLCVLVHTVMFRLAAMPPWGRRSMPWAEAHMASCMTLWSAMTPKCNCGLPSVPSKKEGMLHNFYWRDNISYKVAEQKCSLTYIDSLIAWGYIQCDTVSLYMSVLCTLCIFHAFQFVLLYIDKTWSYLLHWWRAVLLGCILCAFKINQWIST